MAEKKISIFIQARNAMQAGLASAGASLQKFGQSAARIGKLFATAFLAAGAAVVGFGTKALMAFAVQDKAEKQAEAAFRAYGEEVTQNTEKVKAFAAAIQDETGKSDESTIALAAKLKLLGVDTAQLEAATKATIALGKAGMGEEQAAKAVAAAMEGDFMALTRYIPALKTATSEAEKAQIVNDFVTKGYAAQKDELNSVSGQWEAFKGRVGDAWEALGGLIAQDGALTGMLKRAGDGVKAFGEGVQKWASGGGMGRLISTFQNFFEIIRHGFNQTSAWVNVARAAIVDGFASAWDSVKKIFTGKWDEIGNVQSERTQAALAVVEENQKKHAERVVAIAQSQAERQNSIAKEVAAVAVEAQEQIVVAVENTAKKEAALKKEGEALAKELAEKEKAAAHEKAQEEIAALEKAQAKREEVSKKTVDDILAEQNAQKARDEMWERSQNKARQLQQRKDAGAHLSKKQEEWLAAFGAVDAAKGGLGRGKEMLDHAKNQLLLLDKSDKTLNDIKTAIEVNNKQMQELMTRA